MSACHHAGVSVVSAYCPDPAQRRRRLILSSDRPGEQPLPAFVMNNHSVCAHQNIAAISREEKRTGAKQSRTIFSVTILKCNNRWFIMS